jgi:hypothetical protein
MRSRRTTTFLATVAAAVLVVAAAPAAHAGKPGKWTTISGPGVINISEPGMFRTADGVVHVATHTSGGGLDSIEVAHVGTNGALTGISAAIPGWEGLTEDPDLLPAPGGGMRMVFGGHRTLVSGDPYNEGYTYFASSDASGVAWTLGPNTQPAVASPQGYASYGTGTTQLADGTLVTAFPLNSTITYQVGNNAPQSFDVPDCCAYDMTLVNDGGTVYAAWYANGDLPEHRGVFVRTLYPSLGPIMQAPASVTGGDSLDTGQAVAMVARAGGGVYVAYLKGYPTAQAVALWKVGTAKPKLVKKSKGADNVAMSAGPGGRLWLAFDDGDDNVGVVHTNVAGTKFGALQRIKTPKNSTVYGVNIEGSGGRGDVIFNNGSAILHQQVLYGLSVKAKPGKIKAGKKTQVTFTVSDAGAAVKGAKVKAKGLSCTTNNKGKCTLTFAGLAAQSFEVVAKEKGYANGYTTVKVKN